MVDSEIDEGRLMKIRQLMLLLGFGTLALTGCDQARDVGGWVAGNVGDNEMLNSPALVLAPGYEIVVDGQGVPIRGFDECPTQGALMSRIFGPAPDEGAYDCVVLSEDRSTVSARLYLPTGPITEEWEIIREIGEFAGGRVYQRTALKRPNGTLVVPVQL